MVELFSELESAGHTITEIDEKRTLLRGWSCNLDVTADSIRDGTHGYQEAVSRFIVCEPHLQESEGDVENELLTQRDVKKCSKVGSQDSWPRIPGRIRRLGRDTREITAHAAHVESRGTLIETASGRRMMRQPVAMWKQRC